jgi:hypothetical protein
MPCGLIAGWSVEQSAIMWTGSRKEKKERKKEKKGEKKTVRLTPKRNHRNRPSPSSGERAVSDLGSRRHMVSKEAPGEDL